MTSIKENKREVLKSCEEFYEELKEIISTDYGYGDYSAIIPAIEDEDNNYDQPVSNLPFMVVNKKRRVTYEGLFEISKMIADDLYENMLVEIGIASQYGVYLHNDISTENTHAQIEALTDLYIALAEAYVQASGFLSIVETAEAILDEHVELVRQSNGQMTDFTKVLRFDVVDILSLYALSGKTIDIERIIDNEQELITVFSQRYFSKKYCNG